MLELADVKYRAGDRDILDGLNLMAAAGECVAVTGPSGSGKTTLLQVCLGLVRPDRGRVTVAGEDITKLRGEGLRKHRARSTGVIFQFGELLPELSPWENVVLPAWFGGDRAAGTGERAELLLHRFGIEPHRGLARTLSGGERQRVAVARALINEPALILADEPTGALDRQNSDIVADLLFGLPRATGCTALLVTHDTNLAARADRVLRLEDGRMVDATPVHEL